jgi:hypothetical protein
MMATKGNRPAAPAADRYAALAIRRGISLAALHAANARDFAIVLVAAARTFTAGREFGEREVNELLRAFLAEAGAMLGTDHVELRRWLVDFRLLERDGYGRVYKAGTPASELVELMGELADVDLAALARSARASDAAQRAERKARWKDAQRNASG